MSDSQKPPGGAEWREDLTGTSVGRFAILSRLGAGGMGQVYRAEDTALKRQVALKRLAPRLRHDLHYRSGSSRKPNALLRSPTRTSRGSTTSSKNGASLSW